MQQLDKQSSTLFHVIMALAGLVVILSGIVYAKAIIIPFLLAVIVAIICQGPRRWLMERHVPGWLSMSLVLVIGSLLILGLVLLVQAPIQQFVNSIPDYSAKLSVQLHELTKFMSRFGVVIPAGNLEHVLQPGSILRYTGVLLNNFGALFTNSFLVLLLVMFMLAESQSIAGKIALLPGDSEKHLQQLAKFNGVVQEYLLIKTMVSLATAILVVVSLLILDVEFPFLWGILAFAFNFIPNVGSIIASIPAVLTATVQQGPTIGLLVGCCYVVINVLIGNFVEPKLMGNKLGLSTLVVFLSLLFWGWIFGPVGMLLSVILTMKIKIALDSGENTKWLGSILGPGVEEPVAK